MQHLLFCSARLVFLSCSILGCRTGACLASLNLAWDVLHGRLFVAADTYSNMISEGLMLVYQVTAQVKGLCVAALLEYSQRKHQPLLRRCVGPKGHDRMLCKHQLAHELATCVSKS